MLFLFRIPSDNGMNLPCHCLPVSLLLSIITFFLMFLICNSYLHVYIIKYSYFILWPFQQHYFLITAQSLILELETGTGTYNTLHGCSVLYVRDPRRLLALWVQILMALAFLYKKCPTKQRRKIHSGGILSS